MSLDYQATDKLKLETSVVYNYAEYSWDWDFQERLDSMGGGNAYYQTWEQNNLIDTYSDLEYEQIEITLGATYNFTEAFFTKVQGTCDIFEADEDYVYGDEDGKSYSGYVAVGYKF